MKRSHCHDANHREMGSEEWEIPAAPALEGGAPLRLAPTRKPSRLSMMEVRPTQERLRAAMMVDPKVDLIVESGNTDQSNSMPALIGESIPGKGVLSSWYRVANQVPAVALVALFHLMVGIPFGVSYFPVGWRSSFGSDEIPDTGGSDNREDELVEGLFPLPGKESLGIRMFLFSTIIGQLVFTFASNFDSAVGLQMVENVPFCHSLASIVIKNQGYGLEALSTLFFLFAFASVVVGLVFYLLGKFELGRIIYFFPSHVLVGCIGGIGVFIAKTGLEVTIDSSLSTNADGLRNFIDNVHLLAVVFLFELALRLLTYATRDQDGQPRYPLLSPIFFIAITPLFYIALWIFQVDLNDAKEAGYFFPPLDACDKDVEATCEEEQTIFNGIFDIFQVLNITTVSWSAVLNSIPTLIALVLFSLIHVPINIPAFAITAAVDVDMNKELIAHGWSNTIAGILGGLQNYMAYTQSVIYFKSGGAGKISSLAVTAVTSVLFVVGPTIASYMPRAMAGTLLLHVGTDLFLEGVYDSYKKYDYLEYAGVWLITLVMTAYGMEAALIAGVIAALSTYAFQSITYPDPIRGCMSAATLRSSYWHRNAASDNILNSDTKGRKRILVVQLQGHLFFGNVAQLTDRVKHFLKERQGTSEEAWVVIMDFSLVQGIDSSAAQAITKLCDMMHKQFLVYHCIFVTGSTDGFPCEYPLSKELRGSSPNDSLCARSYRAAEDEYTSLLESSTASDDKKTYGTSINEYEIGDATSHVAMPPENFVCNDLNTALVFSEDAIIAREDPNLLDHDLCSDSVHSLRGPPNGCSLEEEKDYAFQLLLRLCPSGDEDDVQLLFSFFEREVYHKNDVLWQQGSASNCTKLLVIGSLISVLENEAGTCEYIEVGNMIGESGLVHGSERMSTVKCLSDDAILYSLSLASWTGLLHDQPKLALFVYGIVVKYLTHRVQHVSNRIFETRCLPV